MISMLTDVSKSTYTAGGSIPWQTDNRQVGLTDYESLLSVATNIAHDTCAARMFARDASTAAIGNLDCLRYHQLSIRRGVLRNKYLQRQVRSQVSSRGLPVVILCHFLHDLLSYHRCWCLVPSIVSKQLCSSVFAGVKGRYSTQLVTSQLRCVHCKEFELLGQKSCVGVAFNKFKLRVRGQCE